MRAYRIKDAERVFEIAEARRLKRLQWLALPNKHDGKGFRRLMRKKNGPAMYGAWICMIQIASKAPTRWLLADDDGPLTTEDMADKTGVPSTLFDATIEALLSPEIGWLCIVEIGEPLGLPSTSLGANSVENKNDVTDRQTRQTDTSIAESATPTPPVPNFPDPIILEYPLAGNHDKPNLWPLTQSRLAKFKQIYPGVNVLQECRSALGWCVTHETRRKTASGMPAFLNGWLTRKQNESQGSESTNGHRPTKVVV